MKIMIVCPRLCHGGAERVAVLLANGFVGCGHEVVFLSDLFEEQTYRLDSAVLVENLVSVPKPKSWKWLSSLWILRRVMKRERPDVVIGIMSLCSVIAWLSAIGLKIPVIATAHDSFEKPDSAPMPWLERFYKFHVSKVFSCFTVLTERDKQILLGTNRNNVVVMPNPLAITPVEELPVKKKTILAAGRVDNWLYKGFDVLIKAWGKVVAENVADGWILKIAGVWRSPQSLSFLNDCAKQSGVADRIEYTGFVEDMKSLYGESAIFVLSSRCEGFGLVLIEAMSQGCACVACDYLGRQREIIRHEGEGLLCKPDDVDALSDHIRRLIVDDSLRESIQLGAIGRSKYYVEANTMNRWESLLKQIIM